MNIEQFEVFRTITQAKSFTKAAFAALQAKIS
jgi:DNA-binding transcriptional LysR family regulator